MGPFKILRKKWNIALFQKVDLDFKMQYLRFYWTDLAEILHASREKAYFSSPKISWSPVNLFGVRVTSKCFLREKTHFWTGYTKKSDVYPI